jgi:DHA2 family multidrug resistance protein
MMFILGLTLYGTTVLLPLYVQTLMGYSAEDAGMVLSPGAVVIMVMMPGIGLAVSKVDARLLIGMGFAILCAALMYMAGSLYPGIDFRTAVMLRVYQSIALAFLFVPINTIVYTDVAPEKNNQVSGIVNLMRNMGGDVGIALVTTLVAQRTQRYQSYLSRNTSGANRYYEARLSGLTHAFVRRGLSEVDAAKRATRTLYGLLVNQARTLAYLDVLRLFAAAALVMIPLLALMKAPRPGQKAPGH